MAWNTIIIDVDYWPSDPGSTKVFTERTTLNRNDLKVGMTIHYDDPSDLMPSIKVTDMDEEGITLATPEMTVHLPDFKGHTQAKLAENGRNYTNFELWVSIGEEAPAFPAQGSDWEPRALSVTHDLAFLRKFYNANQIARLSEADIDTLRESDDPYAKYAYARWLVVTNLENGSFDKAYQLYEEAEEGGCIDATMGLSLMYDNGDAGVVDKELAITLRDNALNQGSEWAALIYARNRIAGYNAEAEPEKVLEEVKQRIATDKDIYPEWYAVLGFAYEQLGDKENAKEMYKKAIDNEVSSAYAYLAILYKEEGDEANYRKWMLEGIDHHCGLCCMLDADMSEEDFQALPEDERDTLYWAVLQRLIRGIVLCEGVCAYLQAYNYYHGTLGFEQNFEMAMESATKGYTLGDPYSCALVADMSEESGDEHECLKLDEGQTAFMRLEALRYGDNSQLEAVVKAYHKGLYEGPIADEVEREWLPQFKLEPIPNLVKDEIIPTVLVIHPNAYTEYKKTDLSKVSIWEPFRQIAKLIDAKDTRDWSVSQPMRDITKAANLEEGRYLTMFYDIDAEKKGLKVNPVATKLSGGKEIRGKVIIALEGDFHPMDCNDSGYRPYYSFTFDEDIEAVFDEIYDLMDGQLYTDDDLEDDDGRFDAYV